MSKLLKDEDRKVITEKYWSKLLDHVSLVYFNSRSKDCEYCEILNDLYMELVETSDMLSLKVYYIEEEEEIASKYRVKKAPAVVLVGRNEGLIKFYGAPAGMEFPSFLETIVLASRGEAKISDSLKRKIINEVVKDINIKVFVTPACPYCPQMASVACQFAIISSHFDVEVWEALEFPEEVRKYDVMAVPKVIINDIVSFEGLVSPNDLFRRVKDVLK